CFDLLHPGHLRVLEFAKSRGDVLVVGLNTDRSVRRLKGPGRPIQSEEDRAALLGALECVDYVVLFDEPTPEKLLRLLKPDVLVKGGDYTPEKVVGGHFVESYGGRVARAGPLHHQPRETDEAMKPMHDRIVERLADAAYAKLLLLESAAPVIEAMAKKVIAALKAGRKVLLFGNGGSAADAQHIACELEGRFFINRRPWPVLALTTNTSSLTAIGNDFEYA